MKLKPVSKYVAGVGSVALLGLAMSGTAAATEFTASATVQNTLTVTNVADMNLGTLFATSASTGAYKAITLGTDGSMGSPAGHADITLLTLGGASAAQASVAVGNTTPFTVTLPDADATLDAGGVEATNSPDAAAETIYVRLGDPAVARFQLVNFRAGAPTGGTAAAGCASGNTCVLTPSFGSTEVTFSVGATVVTDVNTESTAGRVTYEAGTYTGTFEVTASY